MKQLLITMLICLAIPAAALAQNTPPTQDSWIARVDPAMANPWPPPVHYKGTPVPYTPIRPGVPLPKANPRPWHLIGLVIDGYDFTIKPGWCADRVAETIRAHELLLTGNKDCDAWIRQARYIQQEEELQDPSYAHERRFTPEPTPVGGDAERPGN